MNAVHDLQILVTGATSGIGEKLAEVLVEHGAKVLVHGRDAAKLESLTERLQGVSTAKLRTFVADLASLSQVARLADEVTRVGGVDVLVNNAGVGFGSDRSRRELSADGFELRFAVNYLAPFLLSERLLQSNSLRCAIINVTSIGQAPLDESDLMSEHSYEGVLAYRRSKLALTADTFERAARDREHMFVALHPGTFLATKMVQEAGIVPLGLPIQGAQAVLHAIERALAGDTGLYFDTQSVARADPAAYDPGLQARLRTRALALTERNA